MLKSYKSKIVVGIVGLGVGGIHLSNCLKYKNCKVKYICDHDKKKLHFYKKKFKTPMITKSYKKIVDDKEVNTVIIASNDSDHAYQVLLALKKNKHVFVEKPLCLTFKDLDKIKSMKRGKPKLLISSNLVLRTHPFFQKLIKNRKKFKQLYFLEGDYNYGRIDKLTKGWRGKVKDYSVILGGGIHLLDLILSLKRSKVMEVYTQTNKIITKKFKSVPKDFAISLIKFKDNSIAKISSNFSSSTDHHHIFNLYSKDSSLFYKRNISEEYFREVDNKPKIELKYKFDNNQKKKMLTNFFDAIISKKNKLIVSENDLFYLMKICLKLVESQKKNKVIKL